MNRLFHSLALFSALALVAPACGDKATEDKKEDSKKDDSKDGSKKKDGAASGSAAASGAPAATPSGAASAAPAVDTPSGGVDALAHMPEGCEAAVAIDLSKIAKHPAVAKEVVPRLDALLTGESKDAKMQRFQGFAKETGLKVSGLRNVGFCVDAEAGKPPSYVAMLGADLKPGTLIPALEKAKNPEKAAPTITEVDGVKFIGDKEMTFAQFADGVVGFGESPDTLKLAIKTGDNASKYKLDRTKELSFFIGKQLISTDLAKRAGSAAEMFKEVEELTGTMDLTSGKIQFVIKTLSPESAKKLDAVATLGKDAAIKDGKAPKQFGADEALKSLTSKIDGSNVILEATFPAASIEEAVKFLGTQLEAAKAKM